MSVPYLVVQLKPFATTLAVAIDRKQHFDIQQDFDLNPFGHWDEEYTPTATTYEMQRDCRPHHLVVVELYEDSTWQSTFVHEAVHVLSFIMERVGAKYDTDNDEWYAYMLGSVFDSLCEAYTSYQEAHEPKAKPSAKAEFCPAFPPAEEAAAIAETAYAHCSFCGTNYPIKPGKSTICPYCGGDDKL